MMVALVVLACAALAAGLVAWRWWLDDRKEQRAHELVVASKRVEVDERAAEEDRARVKRLEVRVTDLEYRPQKR